MKSLQSGLAEVDQRIHELAEQVLETFPVDVSLLAGVLLDGAGLPDVAEARVALDLVAVTEVWGAAIST